MDFVPKNLVCVFAHPDDEAFSTGGSIAYFADKGAQITLVCITNGASFGKEKLAEIRKRELLNSANILGIKDVVFLGFQDGDLNNNNYHLVTEKLKKILERIKPDTLLTYYLDGVSGHLDHVAVSLECSYLFERLRYIKNILYFCNSKGEKKLVGKNYFIYFPEGHDKKDADWVLDVGEYFDKKKRAMLAHKSQRGDAIWLLTFLRKYLKEELFIIRRK